MFYYTRVWREYLQQKYQTISKIINNIKKTFLCVCIKWSVLPKKHIKIMT